MSGPAGRERRGSVGPRRQGGAAHSRLLGLLVGILLGFVLLAGRLVQVQALSASREAAYARSQLVHTIGLFAERGSILDRHGHVLAMSLMRTTVYADPTEVTDPVAEAAALAPVLKLASSELTAELRAKGTYVPLAIGVDGRVAKAVKALGLPGIGEAPQAVRVHPDGSLAAPLLGVVGLDGSGLSGLEYGYDGVLRGRPGEEVVEEDPQGRVIAGGVLVDRPAVPGTSIELTIDQDIQYETEQALAREIVAAKAAWGAAVVLDARTGGLLALADLVARPGAAPGPAPSAEALTAVYEPGSVMKITTFSGALEEGIITPDTVLSVPNDLVLGGAVFHDDVSHPTEQLSATQILARSSNVGTIEIAQRLGPAGVEQYLRAFGYGEPTGLHYPGASPGLLRPVADWSGSAIGSTPIGQDTGVTLLQIADAFNVLANDGVFVPPRLVQATVPPGGSPTPLPLAPRRRVVSATVAREVTGMLEQVVTSPDGTGTLAAIPGYTVAGKTGTAQIPSSSGPGYVPGAFMATFAGFAPASDPAVTAAVVLARPTQIYGGSVAAPVFSQIVRYALWRLGVPPDAPTGLGSAGTTLLAPAAP